MRFAAFVAALALVCVLYPGPIDAAKPLRVGPGATANCSLQYLAFYEYNVTAQHAWTNLAIVGAADQLALACTPNYGLHVMFDATWYLYQWTNTRVSLRPDYKQQFTSFFQSTIQPLQNKGCSLIGVFLGDEILWQGLSIADLTTVSSFVRSTWPDAVIYENEAEPVVELGVNIFNETVNFTAVPTNIDWFSIDFYRLDDSSWILPQQEYYPNYIYPKMAPHQCALVVPGSYASTSNPNFSYDKYVDFMLRQAYSYYDWALTDPMIIGMNPWYFNPVIPRIPNFELSTSELPRVVEAWKLIGAKILGNQRV